MIHQCDVQERSFCCADFTSALVALVHQAGNSLTPSRASKVYGLPTQT